jgi:polygalacturonase
MNNGMNSCLLFDLSGIVRFVPPIAPSRMLAPLLLGVLLGPAAGQVFNVLDFGAKGDGVTLDTAALRSALAAAEAAGGGRVLLPLGYTFLTGSLNLTSNVELFVAGTLKASPVATGGNYALVPPLPWYGGGQDAQQSGAPEWSAVLRSFGARNVSLRGGGTLDGNGGAPGGWWDCFHASPALGPPPCSGFSRPQLLRLIHTTDVVIEDLAVRDSPAWTLHLANVTRARLARLNITAPADQGNTDGVDVDCSSDVLIEDVYYAGGDDAIAVKSGIDWLGYTYGRRTEHVLVRRLRVESGNGVAVGSEQSAGVHNVTFANVTVTTAALGKPIKHGPYMKSQRGRGGLASDIAFVDWTVHGVGFAIGLTLEYHVLPPTNATATPRYQNVSFANFVSDGCASTYSFQGLNDSILAGISLANMNTSGDRSVGKTCAFAQGVCGAGVSACPPCFTPAPTEAAGGAALQGGGRSATTA